MSLFSFPSFLSPKLSEFTDDELAVMGLVRKPVKGGKK
jgi:hypothetical protein